MKGEGEMSNLEDFKGYPIPGCQKCYQDCKYRQAVTRDKPAFKVGKDGLYILENKSLYGCNPRKHND